MRSRIRRWHPGRWVRCSAQRSPASQSRSATPVRSLSRSPAMIAIPPWLMRTAMWGMRGNSSVRRRFATTISNPTSARAPMPPTNIWTRSQTPFSRAFSRAAYTATGSRSNATAEATPSRSPAMASTPLPVPTSSSRTRPRCPAIASSSSSRASRVEAWCPVPNAWPGSMTTVSWPGWLGCATKLGRTTSRGETTNAPRPSRQVVGQSTSATASGAAISAPQATAHAIAPATASAAGAGA
jgi:hypothetical protein